MVVTLWHDVGVMNATVYGADQLSCAYIWRNNVFACL